MAHDEQREAVRGRPAGQGQAISGRGGRLNEQRERTLILEELRELDYPVTKADLTAEAERRRVPPQTDGAPQPDAGAGGTSRPRTWPRRPSSPGRAAAEGTAILTRSADGPARAAVRGPDPRRSPAGGADLPADTNADGTDDDVSGNGRIAFGDVVRLFDRLRPFFTERHRQRHRIHLQTVMAPSPHAKVWVDRHVAYVSPCSRSLLPRADRGAGRGHPHRIDAHPRRARRLVLREPHGRRRPAQCLVHGHLERAPLRLGLVLRRRELHGIGLDATDGRRGLVGPVRATRASSSRTAASSSWAGSTEWSTCGTSSASTDQGATWTRQTDTAGWAARREHASVALPDGAIVLMGGIDSTVAAKNDVWRSTDKGVTWTRVNESAGWAARWGHTAVALTDGSIVLMGGARPGGRNDVWRSTDRGSDLDLRERERRLVAPGRAYQRRPARRQHRPDGRERPERCLAIDGPGSDLDPADLQCRVGGAARSYECRPSRRQYRPHGGVRTGVYEGRLALDGLRDHLDGADDTTDPMDRLDRPRRPHRRGPAGREYRPHGGDVAAICMTSGGSRRPRPQPVTRSTSTPRRGATRSRSGRTTPSGTRTPSGRGTSP